MQVWDRGSTKPPADRGKKLKMDHVTSTLINLAEAAYDMDAQDADWLTRIVAAGFPLLDRGLGVLGGFYTRPVDGGAPKLQQLHLAACSKESAVRLAGVAARIPQPGALPYRCMTLSEAMGESEELATAVGVQHNDSAKDALVLWVMNPDGLGAFILAPLFERTVLTAPTRHRWRMVGAHLSTGFHLRRALRKKDEGAQSDDKRGTEACEAIQALRRAAVLADRTRGPSRKADSDAALRLWENLVDGHCSLLDGFDSDTRRFVLATCKRPGVKDPHGLTRREHEVTALAAQGESGKLIGYHLGLSSSRVSELLHDAMRKLRVHTQAELVAKVSRLGLH